MSVSALSVPHSHLPSPTANIVASHSSVSYFHKILTPEIIDRLNSSSELTLFLPEDTAWDALDPIEKLYLESGFAAHDLRRIFEMHTVEKKTVKWSDSFQPAINCKLSKRILRLTSHRDHSDHS